MSAWAKGSLKMLSHIAISAARRAIAILIAKMMAATWTATRGIGNLYLRLGAKIAMAAALYVLLMWRLRSKIFYESIQYLFKKKKIV